MEQACCLHLRIVQNAGIDMRTIVEHDSDGILPDGSSCV